jgi:hypothetical protein
MIYASFVCAWWAIHADSVGVVTLIISIILSLRLHFILNNKSYQALDDYISSLGWFLINYTSLYMIFSWLKYGGYNG